MPYISLLPKIQRKYKLVLHESNLNDIYIGPAVRELRNARSKNFQLALNRGGNLSFTLPLDSNITADVIGYEVRRCVVVYVKDSDVAARKVVGSWPITNVQASSDGTKVNVQCTAWQELMGGREFMRSVVFADLMPGELVKRMISTINTQIFDESVDIFSGKGGIENDFDYIARNKGDGKKTKPAGMDMWPSLSSEWSVTGSNSVKLSFTNYTNYADLTYGVYLANKDFSKNPPPELPGISDIGYDLPLGTDGKVEPSINVSFYAKTNALSNTSVGFYCYFYDKNGAWLNNFSGTYPAFTNITSRLVPDGVARKITIPVNVPSSAATFTIYVGLSAGPVNSTWTGYLDGFRAWPNTADGNVRAAEVKLPFDVSSGISTPGGPAARTRTMAIGQKLDAAIQELSDIEGGFDYEIATEEVAIVGDPQQKTNLMRKFYLRWDLIKTGSTIYGKGVDQKNVVFGKKWGPRNVAELQQNTDGSKLANRIIVRDPAGRAFVAQDLNSIKAYGLIQDTITISDAGYKDTVLQAYAGAELAYRRVPFTTYGVRVKSFMGRRNVPRLFKDYNIGDITYLVSREKNMNVGLLQPQAIRVFGATVSIDDEGNESVQSLQTTASG